MSNSPLPTTDPTVLTGAQTPHPRKGRWRSALGASVTGIVGGVVFLPVCAASLIPPWFIMVPAANSTPVYALPSVKHFLGTDADGRDVLTMTLLSGRDITIVSIISATVSMGIAVALGVLTAYLRGWVDPLVIQSTDSTLTVSQFALLVVLAIYMRFDSPAIPALLLRGLGWSGLLRVVRTQVLSLKEREHVEAARIAGLSTPIITGRKVLLNTASYPMIRSIFVMTGATYTMMGLYLLGLAFMAGTNWGIMISNAWTEGVLFFTNAAWSIMAPLLVVSVLWLSAIQFARTLEQLLNPRPVEKRG